MPTERRRKATTFFKKTKVCCYMKEDEITSIVRWNNPVKVLKARGIVVSRKVLWWQIYVGFSGSTSPPQFANARYLHQDLRRPLRLLSSQYIHSIVVMDTDLVLFLQQIFNSRHKSKMAYFISWRVPLKQPVRTKTIRAVFLRACRCLFCLQNDLFWIWHRAALG